jgi:hypothetical protein
VESGSAVFRAAERFATNASAGRRDLIPVQLGGKKEFTLPAPGGFPSELGRSGEIAATALTGGSRGGLGFATRLDYAGEAPIARKGARLMRRLLFGILIAAAMSLALPTGLAAQEHPTSEHPSSEHPSASKPITMDQLAQAIQEAIAAKTKEQGGQFHVADPVLHKTWALQLVRVHKDRLAQLGPDTYFACTDFRANDGAMLDVDFYMKNDNGKLVFSDTAIHKVNGKARFTYEKKGDYWERVKVGS